MFEFIQKAALVKLALRYVRSHERLSDAVCDLRDHYCGQRSVALNRGDDVDIAGIEVSYASDADTFDREVAKEAKVGRFGRGNKGPWEV